MASKKGNRANNHQNKDSTSGVRGEDRKAHFANGGSLAEWRGLHRVHTSRAEKRKTRRTERQQAIRDSQED